MVVSIATDFSIETTETPTPLVVPSEGQQVHMTCLGSQDTLMEVSKIKRQSSNCVKVMIKLFIGHDQTVLKCHDQTV